MLSTHSKNISKFRDAGATSEIIKRIDWGKDGIADYEFSLYIEDKRNHDNYNHLANRFYEALKCNCVMFFDINCKNTVETSKIDFDNYFYVSSYEELQEKIKRDNFYESLAFQSRWKIQSCLQKKDMINDFIKIIEKE
jgi:hypothetical protein